MENLTTFEDQRRRVMEIAGIDDQTCSRNPQIVATYDYLDQTGALTYQVVRFDPKDFRQRRPDGHGGWTWNLNGTRRVLYRLGNVLKAGHVACFEGEKDVETAYRLGLPDGWAATCNPGGAKKWRSEYSETLRGKGVVIIGDNDAAGQAHVKQVKESLHGIAQSVRLALLPTIHKDFTDWADAGGTAEEFHRLLEGAASIKSTERTKQDDGRSDRDDHDDHDDHKPKRSQATQLIQFARQHVEFFHAPDREAFASIKFGDHQEVWPIKSKSFRHWLAGRFYQETSAAIGGQAMQDALGVLSAMAVFEGPERPVGLRVAEYEGAIYLDLANSKWEAVQVTREGWTLITESPIPFRRPKSMLALPAPLRGGSIQLLRDVINITDDRQWSLLVGFLVAALRPQGPFPVQVIDGEQGTGKSWIAEVVKNIIDPAMGANRGEPRDVRDLMIAASNGWLLSFDNLSRISGDLSDGLCRLSTGGGLATRELFSDADETVFDATRPTIINAIGDVVTRPDLVDRSIVVTPNTIPETERRQKHALLSRFHEIRPLVLGALLDAVSHGLRTVHQVRLPRIPRMADFAVWVTACAPAFGWDKHTFIDTYFKNREDAVEIGLEASPSLDHYAPWWQKDRGRGLPWNYSTSSMISPMMRSEK